MLTPQEVSEHSFSKASFGGYNMAQVDEFLDAVTADYTALYKENAVLKSKMKVLVEKVEEYRATEDAMRKTLLSAQRMADAIVAEAKEARDAALLAAEAEAQTRVSDLRRQIEAEEYRLTAAKDSTKAYLLQLKKLFEQEQTFLSRLSELAPPPPEPPDPVESAAAEIEDSIHRLMEEDSAPGDGGEGPEDTKELFLGQPDKAPEPAPAAEPSMFQIIDLTVDGAAAPDEDSATHRIDFNNLQFGKDYEIK